MSNDNPNPILGAIENINAGFEQFKKTNDEILDNEKKGNLARAKELTEQLDRIEADIQSEQKSKKNAERAATIVQERVEILEAANDRPGKTLAEKSTDEYKEKFLGALRGKFNDAESNLEAQKAYRKMAETKTIQIGSASLGGHAVPEDISRDIEELMLRSSDILQILDLKTVGTSDYKELISINDTGSAWAAELGSRSQQSDPNLVQIAPTMGELYTYLFASNEALEDMFFDVENWFVTTAAESSAKALDLAVWSGDGSSKPTGMINTAPVSTADGSPQKAAAAYQYIPTDSASPQALGGDDLLDLVYSLNRSYRRNAQFGCNQNTQAAIRKLKDGNSQYLWQPSYQAGQPDMLLGYSVFTYEDMADPTTADGLYCGFGDWNRAYTLITRRGLAVTKDDNITTPGTVKFYIRQRFGGIVANNDSLKFLKLADS
jgi:HK97 family phage major capsid protein